MNRSLLIILFTIASQVVFSQNYIKDKTNNDPISFATISFGNGYGTFADDEGKFVFTKKTVSRR